MLPCSTAYAKLPPTAQPDGDVRLATVTLMPVERLTRVIVDAPAGHSQTNADPPCTASPCGPPSSPSVELRRPTTFSNSNHHKGEINTQHCLRISKAFIKYVLEQPCMRMYSVLAHAHAHVHRTPHTAHRTPHAAHRTPHTAPLFGDQFECSHV